jgi:TolB-like protein/Flp pilus assembly protein TadD
MASGVVAVCSRCGEPLNAKGDCLACLLRTGLDKSVRETKPLVSLVFGDFEVEQRPDGFYWELGHGGMGVTYLAVDKVLRRRVALKVIEVPEAARGSQAVRERFLREARAAAALRHPNVAAVFQFGASPDASHCYYAMELVEGETLETRVRRDGPLDAKAALEIAIQITRALMAAAAHDLIHRDLKPGNIMLTSGNAATEFEVKVIDFGLAKAIADAGGETDLTHGEFVGTLNFASPEQLESGPVDSRSDIYSLGATLWFALTGLAPHSGSTIEEIRDRQTWDDLPVAHLVARKVPEPVVKLLRSTLAVDPSKRPASARELMEALESCRAKLARGGMRSFHKLTMLIAVVAIAAAALFALRLTRQAPNAPPSQPGAVPEKSIAVLPFLDLSQAKDQEYFCDGISEEILDALAKVDGLRVVAHTSSFSFKGKNADAGEVGKKLNVENVLQGSLRRDGNRIRITAQLINTRNGLQLWSETYERELQGVFALQDEITGAIVDALKIKLAVSLPAREQPNTEAYDLYLQGLYFSNKGGEKDLREALNFFQRALEKDPTFSRAWTGIAKVWFFLADVYVRPLEAYPASRAAALKAIELDEKDAEAHCYLGEAKRVLDWDLAGEDAELNRALQLDPNSAPVHFFLALLPLIRGDLKEGLHLVVEAEKLDPLSPIISYVTTAAYLADNRIDEAISEGERTQHLDQHYFYLDSNLAAANREKGNFAEAIALYKKAQEERRFPSSGLAITYARMGQQIEARKILDQLLQERQTRYVSAQTIAAVYVAFGEKDEAFRWLELAATHHTGTLQWIALLPEFGALRPDARFPHFLRRIGVSHGSVLAITEATLVETKDPSAQAHLTLKVGVKPRPGTPNGHIVRISVSFYDLTKDNKMKPTDARTAYDWLTPARDWTDATPKFLAATYVRPKTQMASSDGRRYGGFIVRVYFDGQLQDARAIPPELLTLFPAEDQLISPPNAATSPSH